MKKFGKMNALYFKNNIQNNYLKKSLSKRLSKNFAKTFTDVISDINNHNKTLSILSKKFKFNFKIKNLKKFKKFKKIAIIGMGGSILGSEAIYNFLGDKINKKLYFFDDLNPKKNFFFKKQEKIKTVLFIIISKSGNTIETITNLINLKILKKNSKNIIVISEKKNNPLYEISKKLNLFYIEHKNNIGGRYSVLSEVGIVPAYLMGVNILKLRSNNLKYLIGRKKFFLKDSVLKLTNLLDSKKFRNIIFLNYAPELEKFLFWCQQLLAESLGKNNKGFLPIISSVPKDHHSLLQLYLDGPKDKLFHIFSIKKNSNEKIGKSKITKSLNFINNKYLHTIKNAQKDALIKTFKKKNIPFRECIINSISEVAIGELFNYFILETIFVGKMSKINPFNQPAVEQVKVLTKKLLRKKTKKYF